MTAQRFNSRTGENLLIIGGGPSGTALAIQLARQGRRVTLAEKTAGPHDKVCGEFLSGEGRSYLELLGINIDALGALPIKTLRVVKDSVIAELPLPFPAWSLRRSLLDEELLKRAADEGAYVLRGKAVKSLERQSNQWIAQLSDGRLLRATEAFLASGKHDLRGWRRSAGLQNDLVAFKFHLACPADQENELRDYIELIFFHGGYAGLQLLEGARANLSLLITKRTLRRCGSQWQKVLKYLTSSSRHLERRLSGAQPLYSQPLAISSIPYGFQLTQAVDDLWAVGDQVAVIPSFTGDGIAIALHSGFVAAEAYHRGASAQDYLQDLSRQLRQPIYIATWISRSVIAMPSLIQALRFCPQLLSQIALRTRIPDHFRRGITD